MRLAYTYQCGDAGPRIQTYESALAKLKVKWPADHLETINCLYYLASNYKEAGKLDKAIPLFVQALEGYKSKYGPDSEDALFGRMCLPSPIKTLECSTARSRCSSTHAGGSQDTARAGRPSHYA